MCIRDRFFGSSHAHDSTCPPKPDPSAGYVWPLDQFDIYTCLLYTSDAADERSSVDLGGRRIIKKKKCNTRTPEHRPTILTDNNTNTQLATDETAHKKKHNKALYE